MHLRRLFGLREHKLDASFEARLERLETAVEQLQLDNTERQIAVLNAAEKVLHQLEARERKRIALEADAGAAAAERGQEPTAATPASPGNRVSRSWRIGGYR